MRRPSPLSTVLQALHRHVGRLTATAFVFVAAGACTSVRPGEPSAGSSSPTPTSVRTAATATAERPQDQMKVVGERINRGYSRYIAALRPDQQEDIARLRAARLVMLPPGQVTSDFEIPASLVTKDRTLKTLDLDALAVAVTARLEARDMGAYPLVAKDPGVIKGSPDGDRVRQLMMPIFEAGSAGFITPGERAVTPKGTDSAVFDAAKAGAVATTYPQFAAYQAPYVLRLEYQNGTARSRVEAGVIKFFSFGVTIADNYPTNVYEMVQSTSREPLDRLETFTAKHVRLVDGNVYIGFL